MDRHPLVATNALLRLPRWLAPARAFDGYEAETAGGAIVLVLAGLDTTFTVATATGLPYEDRATLAAVAEVGGVNQRANRASMAGTELASG